MKQENVRKKELEASAQWQQARRELDDAENRALTPGNGRGDGGQGAVAFIEALKAAGSREERCWRLYQHVRQERIDADAEFIKRLLAGFGVVLGLCTILQTIEAVRQWFA